MITIKNTLTALVWYNPTTALTAIAGIANFKTVRTISATGSGYNTFAPGASFNSLANVSSGQILIVEALAASIAGGTGFALDNGVAPTSAGTTAVQLIATLPAGGLSTVNLPLFFNDTGGNLSLDPANVAVGLTGISYQVNGIAVTLPAPIAAGQVLSITATTANTVGGTIVLLKQ